MAQEGSSPNLDKKTLLTSQSPKRQKIAEDQKGKDKPKVAITGIKCSCGKAWCPRCGLRTAIRRFARRIKGWDWRFVRQVVLTVDPKLYESPEEALKEINGKRQIAGTVRNLERTIGVKVQDWQWVLEWHRNGFPHWHLFLLVDKPGKEGQIGYQNIVRYWDSGHIKGSSGFCVPDCI